MTMFCRQCEQTMKGIGCNMNRGVCGKEENTAVLQDLLVYILKGIAVYGKPARELGQKDKSVDRCLIEGLFTTVTNVNFDEKRLQEVIVQASQSKEKIKALFLKAYKEKNGREFDGALPAEAALLSPDSSLKGLIEQGRTVGLISDPAVAEDVRSLRETLLYGLKGMAAYADHASLLGKEDEKVQAFFHTGMAALADASLSSDDLLSLIMDFGQVNLRCMEILDEAHTGHFGHPVPTKVSLGVKKGPAIVVSGHDLLDLQQLLQQTEGTGINIYTHGEMLPAHGYPELNKYKHLAGHFGTAWQNQQKEFDRLPAAILMTTNCIQKPQDSYKDNIFTTGLVAWPGVKHIKGNNGKKDFSTLIARAKALGGFSEDNISKNITVGFGHNTVLGIADKVVEAVKKGAVKHFFLIGGCDGAKPGRNYYTEFAQKVPDDCIILTLACGKFRFNSLDFGTVGGIPRLLDIGQCNDAYSAIKIALALADAFKCSVNDLPLSLILSWYEQKAVCILLTLLSLGIKNIKLGPSLPAFITPAVLKILIGKYNIQPVTNAAADLDQILSGK